jgi:aryl carrier-like protein
MARDHHVDVLLLQETNVRSIGIPAAVAGARRQGWHAWFVAAPSERRGGVGILVRDGIGARVMHSCSTEAGQFLALEVIDGLRGISVASLYSHSEQVGLRFVVEEWAWTTRKRRAVLGGDFNRLAHEDSVSDPLHTLGFTLAAAGRYVRGHALIDQIWTANVVSTGSVRGDLEVADHDMLQLDLAGGVGSAREEVSYKFKAHARVQEAEAQQASGLTDDVWDDGVPWATTVATQDAEGCWRAWSRQAERYLVQAGAIAHQPGAQPRGRCPVVIRGGKAAAPGQDHRERRLRRLLRQACEARLQARLRGPGAVAPGLRRRLQQGARELGFGDASCTAGQWAGFEDLLRDALGRHLHDRQKEALHRWRESMQDDRRAIQWAKREAPPPAMVQTAGGEVAAGPLRVVRELRGWWADLWANTVGRDLKNVRGQARAFFEASGRHPIAPAPRHRILVSDLQGVLRGMTQKAAGLDGFSADLVLQLPPAMLERLVDIYDKVEGGDPWPQALCAWRVCFLAKEKREGFPEAGNFRPIAVGAVLYRAWAAVRTREVAMDFSKYFHRGQGGGRGTPDPATLVLAMLQAAEDHYEFGASLDLYKAFDSISGELAADVLEWHGLDTGIAGAVRSAWRQQRRWAAFGGEVAHETIGNCAVLPQGDPWSPWAMSLLVGLMVGVVARRTGDRLLQFQFLDDRTVLARCSGDLAGAVREWDLVSESLNLQNNAGKLQVWTRAGAHAELPDQFGDNFTQQPKVLGLCARAEGGTVPDFDEERWLAAERIASRLRMLPVSQERRWRLARMLVAPKVAWCFSSGREPTKSETGRYKRLILGVLLGRQRWARTSWHLRLAVQLGYQGDLDRLALLTHARGVLRWITGLAASGQVADVVQATTGSTCRRLMTRLGAAGCDELLCRVDGRGSLQWRWGIGGRTWEVGYQVPVDAADERKADGVPVPVPEQAKGEGEEEEEEEDEEVGGKCLTAHRNLGAMWHAFRQLFRTRCIEAWLATGRRDAQAAREDGLAPDEGLVRMLRRLHSRVSSHGKAVMLGGMITEATVEKAVAEHLTCSACGDGVPSLTHVLWKCQAFQHERRIPEPPSVLAARLGWTWRRGGADVDFETLVRRVDQMGRVREMEVKSRPPERRGWRRPEVVLVADPDGQDGARGGGDAVQEEDVVHLAVRDAVKVDAGRLAVPGGV